MQHDVAISEARVAPGGVRPGGRTARNRAAVLAAALAELVSDGYEGLSLDAVAARAGVHKTTVYRRWGSKERLVADTLQAIAVERTEVPDSGDVEEDLRRLARSVVLRLVTPEGAGAVRAMVMGAQRSDVVRGIVAAFWADRAAQAGVIVTRAVTRGQLPEGTSPTQVIRHLGAPLYHQLLVTLEPLDAASADLAATATVTAARAGVFATASSHHDSPDQ